MRKCGKNALVFPKVQNQHQWINYTINVAAVCCIIAKRHSLFQKNWAWLKERNYSDINKNLVLRQDNCCWTRLGDFTLFCSWLQKTLCSHQRQSEVYVLWSDEGTLELFGHMDDDFVCRRIRGTKNTKKCIEIKSSSSWIVQEDHNLKRTSKYFRWESLILGKVQK